MAREREPRVSRTTPASGKEASASAALEKWPQLRGEIRGGAHVLPVRVYYEDTDFTGIVYHASFLRFMERGRTEYMRLIGAGHRELFEQAASRAPGFGFVVRSMRIDYLKPARMDDVLEVTTAPEQVKGASVSVLQRVARDREVLVEARVRLAFVAGGRARPIPRPLRIAMRADRERAIGSGSVTKP
jgi:acyl-CoA thioester hydrolase